MKKISLSISLFVLFVTLFTFISLAEDGVKKNLGKSSISFGSAGQAKELLLLINQQPNNNNYQITYETEEDVVVFGCDYSKKNIARVHQRKDGTGTAEAWTGEVNYRLQAAAKGGSLNDTSEGKIPGTRTNY